MQEFSLPDSEFISKWGPELKNHSGVAYHDKVVKWRGKHWLVMSSNHSKKERLAFLLGKDLVNITDVQLPTESSLEFIRKVGIPLGTNNTIRNTFLTRLVQDYSSEELNLKSLEEAVAGELIFSLWIRRRDAHAYNRAYIQGVPMFFDNHIAFGVEPEPSLKNIDTFFQAVGDGYAGSWRVVECNDESKITTSFTRDRSANPRWGGLHFVRNIGEFKEQIQKFIGKIVSGNFDLVSAIAESGFIGEDAANIEKILKESCQSLPQDSTRMLEVIFKN